MTSRIKLARLERSILSEQVAKVITEGLLSGQFRSGDRLVENDLAEALGVSRSPIREALAELEMQGLISKEPGRGAVIRKWSAHDLRELYAVRGLLEGFAARLVAEQIPEVNLNPLESIIAEMEGASSTKDYAKLVALDVSFHQLLWELSGNKLLQNVLTGLKHQIQLFLTLNWKFHGGVKHVPENHWKVIRALRSGDLSLIDEVMAEHVVVERMLGALMQVSTDTDPADKLFGEHTAKSRRSADVG